MKRPLAGRFRGAWIRLKKDLSRYYAGEILEKKRKSLVALVFYALSLIIFPILALFLLLYLVSIFLPWQDIPSPAGFSPDLFYPYLQRIRNFELISRIFFGFSLFFLGFFFIGVNIRLSGKKNEKRTFLNINDVI